jgi:hypothetical protein
MIRFEMYWYAFLRFKHVISVKTQVILSYLTGTLAGGTNMGNVALWKYSPPLGGRVVDGEMKWKLQAPATVEGPIKQIRVGHSS